MNLIVNRMRRCPLQTLFSCSRTLLKTPKQCYPPSSYSTLSSTELSTEDGLSPSAQERVLTLLSQYKDLPSFKKSKQLSLDRVTSWVNTGSGHIHPSTYNFLLHVCVSCGSADDMDIAMAVAQRQNLELNESEMNSVLTSLSCSADLAKVKETMNNMSKSGLKIRLNTLTSLLQRGVDERDFSFTLEIIDVMRRNDFFPSSPAVIGDAIRACVSVESSEAVRVVEGVMALHNSYSMAAPRQQVDQETATEFSNWFTSSSSKENLLTHTRINEKCVCESCGEKLLNNKLTPEERNTLICYFKEEIIADISTGSEAAREKHFMRKFLEYVNENSERFGAVIDGLNIAYLCKRRKEVAFETMLAIGRELVSVTGKEVLMVGREHLLRTLAAGRMSPDSIHEEYKSHGVHFVPLRNSTPDDRYILYAAMVTNSVILSNDKFGYEMDRVNQNEIAKLVRKWLDGSHAKINIDRNAIKLFFPTSLQRAVQWTDNGWHLPLKTPSPKNWLCARTVPS